MFQFFRNIERNLLSISYSTTGTAPLFQKSGFWKYFPMNLFRRSLQRSFVKRCKP